EHRLVSHHRYGPMIVRWRERRAIPRRAKWFATWGMVASSGMIWFTPAPPWLQFTLPMGMLLVGLWIWTRPEA
ncbi:MAG TPA: YbaN family protein, partial [Albitalea sp.]|nr:YbaN family protein [Albitalea sp.]